MPRAQFVYVCAYHDDDLQDWGLAGSFLRQGWQAVQPGSLRVGGAGRPAHPLCQAGMRRTRPGSLCFPALQVCTLLSRMRVSVVLVSPRIALMHSPFSLLEARPRPRLAYVSLLQAAAPFCSGRVVGRSVAAVAYCILLP